MLVNIIIHSLFWDFVSLINRLTFWLSNAIILRAMVSQITEEIPPPAEPSSTTETKSGRKKSEKKTPLNDSIDSLGDWEDPRTFIMALEKVEAWIFFRIVEGLWWQVLPNSF